MHKVELNTEDLEHVSGGMTTKEEYIKFHEQLEQERRQNPHQPAPDNDKKRRQNKKM